MIEESKSEAGAPASEPASQWNDGGEALEKEPMTDEECTFEDFMKVDMRVARVIEAGHVEGADKLLQLTLSLGGRRTAQRVRGHQERLRPGGPGWPPCHLLRQPETA